MARNSSGTYTLPAGNPVVTSTTISTTWANTTLGDLATEISDSASRSGKGNFTAPVRTVDGTVATPAVAFVSEPASGMYKAGTGDVRLAVGGVDALQLGAGGVSGTIAIVSAGQGNVSATATNAGLQLSGNRAAADGNPDVYIQGVATRTAGYIADFRHGGGDRLLVDYQGLLRLAAAAAAIQPGSLVTALTPNGGWTASNNPAFWKDAAGKVHLRGTLTNNTGGATASIITTSPLAAGFRPANDRVFVIPDTGFATPGTHVVVVSSTGTITCASGDSIQAVGKISLDGISFLAEA